MNARPPKFLPWLLLPTLAACVEKKDLSPPPLNPHPKEALHITVSFDRPEDAKRYVIGMRALYQNQERDCGYIASWWIGNFVYPEGTFDIPNESDDPRHAKFTVYLDRYNQERCNWELASPDFTIRDTRDGRIVSGGWGLREDLVPRKEYKAICPFRSAEYALSCFGRHPVPDSPFYNGIPPNRRIPVTVRVSEDSAPLRPVPQSFFSAENFVKPAITGKASRAASDSQ